MASILEPVTFAPGMFRKELTELEAFLKTTSPLNDGLSWSFLLFLISAMVSTVASLSPGTSLRGAPETCAGLGTVTAGVVLFFGARALLDTSSPSIFRTAVRTGRRLPRRTAWGRSTARRRRGSAGSN